MREGRRWSPCLYRSYLSLIEKSIFRSCSMLFALRFESDFTGQNLRISVGLFGCRLCSRRFSLFSLRRTQWWKLRIWFFLSPLVITWEQWTPNQFTVLPFSFVDFSRRQHSTGVDFFLRSFLGLCFEKPQPRFSLCSLIYFRAHQIKWHRSPPVLVTCVIFIWPLRA
jgi:hypothetical protein